MEGLQFVSKYYNLNKKEQKWALIAIYMAILLYDILHLTYISKGCDPLNSRQFLNDISMVICHFTMGGIIAVWGITGPRFLKGHEELEGFLYKLTGVDKEHPVSRGKEEARVLWETQLQWICVLPSKSRDSETNLDGMVENFV